MSLFHADLGILHPNKGNFAWLVLPGKNILETLKKDEKEKTVEFY